jgi:hypothetical protein
MLGDHLYSGNTGAQARVMRTVTILMRGTRPVRVVAWNYPNGITGAIGQVS